MRSTIFALAATAAMAADVSVTWRHEKATGNTSLIVHDAATDAVLAEACGASVAGLKFNVDDAGTGGTFTADGKSFDIHSKSQGGVSCNRIYSDDVAVVECTGVKVDIPAGTATSADCFKHEDSKEEFHMLKRRNAVINGPKAVEVEERTTPVPDIFGLRTRQIGCGPQNGYDLVGDGNPHQNYYLKQLSQVIGCAAGGCSVGESQSKSYTIGFTVLGASKGGFFTGGFSVSETWTTGKSYTCNGVANEDLCLWYNTAHTAYTVQPYTYNSCTPGDHNPTKSTVVYKSPNSANRGGKFYCVLGASCRAQGDAYWDNSGRAGGP